MADNKLKHLGARRGEIGRHTLKLGSIIVKIDHIAAIMMSEDKYHPNNGPLYERIKAICPALIFVGASLTVIGGVASALSAAEIFRDGEQSLFLNIALVGIVIGFVAFLTNQAVDWHVGRTQSFYRLMVETSGGTRFAWVDHGIKRLTEVRELLHRKLETGDADMSAAFDFDLDQLDVFN